MKAFKLNEDILTLIERKRLEMVVTASKTGLSSCQTLKMSMELDALLNCHQRISQTKNNAGLQYIYK